MQQHCSGRGSAWTQKHKVIATVEIIENIDNFDEDKYVKKYINQYGIDKVRGGSYVQVNLPYFQLQALERESWTSNNACYNCGNWA